tara:strand:+ start:1068 stop:1193 length:126 start_codon:yes stop_codon:yes gene_type:complete
MMDMEKLPPDELAKATNVGMDKDMEKFPPGELYSKVDKLIQ